MQRSMPGFREACEYVRSGRIGKIHTVKVGIPGVNYDAPNVPDSEPPSELNYDLWLGPAPKRPYNKNHVHYNFRFFWDYSGGQMTNWGAHHLDIAQWGLDMDNSGPVEIEGKAEYDKEKRFEVPVLSEVTFQYGNGVKMILEQKAGVPIGTTFIGDKGNIYVNRGKLTAEPADILQPPLAENEVHLITSKNHYDNWYEGIKTGKLPVCDVEIGHRSATVCHLGNIAMRVGRKIKWDPAKEQIVGDSEAAKLLSYSYRAPWIWPVV
jgi:predicted dehydrogenase